MSDITRRKCLLGLSAASLLAPVPASAFVESSERLDLVIKGGDVLDPSQSLHARYDIGIRAGRIAALEPHIPAGRAHRVLDATGRLVVPAPIDLHASVRPFGMSSDRAAGDRPTGTDGFSAWRRELVGETISPEKAADFCRQADVHMETSALDRCADNVIGLTLRPSQAVLSEHGLEPLKRAIRVCAGSHRPALVMVDISNIDTPDGMSGILDLLRAGDIVTRCYSDNLTRSVRGTTITPNGRLLAAALAAKRRGVLFDIGRGGFDAGVAEAAIAQGAPPDIITPDLFVMSGTAPCLPVLSATVGRLLDIGLELEQVIAMATLAPARILGGDATLGTLQIGAPGDVAVVTLVERTVSYTNGRDLRTGNVSLRTAHSLRAGLVNA